MTQRITDAMLDARCDYLNKITGNPAETYTRDDDGRLHSNAGNYHIDSAYGGVSLDQICKSGGSRDVLGSGHVLKRELLSLMRAYEQGLYEGGKS